jgi:C-terminal processing protease CtpA/Prc
VVLIDSDCFSATDVVAGALRGLPRVTLLGRATAGGSGRAQTHRLPSGLRVRLSTMASFQPDGTPYDGVGIAPDIAVEPAATDFLGRTDRVLDAALARLR